MYAKGEWHKIYDYERLLIADSHNNTICEMHTLGSGDEQYDIENMEANAHLIATAPDLYEACEKALRTFEAHGIKPTDPRYLMLQQALTKAKGGE